MLAEEADALEKSIYTLEWWADTLEEPVCMVEQWTNAAEEAICTVEERIGALKKWIAKLEKSSVAFEVAATALNERADGIENSPMYSIGRRGMKK